MRIRITESERAVLAAYFARSNMGQMRPDRREIEPLLSDGVTLPGAVIALCQEFMESDEHYDIFMKEAKMWASRRYFGGKYCTREAIIGTWPHIKEVFWPEGANDEGQH